MKTVRSGVSRSRVFDFLNRLVTAGTLGVFAVRAARQDLAGRLPLLLLFVAETLSVVLVLLARRTERVDRSAEPLLLTLLGTFYFFFVDLGPGLPLIAYPAGEAIQIAGITLQIAGKAWLGRSFGLLPANRGVVTGGPYRLVRHPIYLGYFLNHMGFLACAYSTHNLVVYALLYAIQIIRVFQEERYLANDAAYAAYKARVPYRFIPLLF
jgi:protein-S-isoprenylcysteine O-methyltransferase Ste14